MNIEQGLTILAVNVFSTFWWQKVEQKTTLDLFP